MERAKSPRSTQTSFVTRSPERSAQRNQRLAEATCDYVLLVDSDMILEPQTVGECLQVAKQTRAAAVVVPESTIGAGRLARIRALERSCYEGNDAIEAARFFRRDVFVAYRGYDEELWEPEDWDLPHRMRLGGSDSGARAARVYCTMRAP